MAPKLPPDDCDEVQPFQPTVSHLNGDIVLRSSDCIDFRVHTVLLCQASAFFQAMFDLPQPNLQIHVVNMSETAVQIDDLLRWIYPLGDRPTYSGVAEARGFLRVAEKFDVPCAISAIRIENIGMAYQDPNPLRQWAIGKIVADDTLRRSAMRQFISKNTTIAPVEELNEVSARDFIVLCDARTVAQHRARKLITATTWEGCGYAHDQNQHPHWMYAFQAKTLSMNPFSEEILSDSFLQVSCTSAAAGSGCIVNPSQYPQNMAITAALSKKLHNILDEIC